MGITMRLPRGRSVVDRLQRQSRLSREALLVIVFIGEEHARRSSSIAGMCLSFAWTPQYFTKTFTTQSFSSKNTVLIFTNFVLV